MSYWFVRSSSVLWMAASYSGSFAMRSRTTEIMRPFRDALQRFARARKDVELVRARLEAEPKPRKGVADPQEELRKALEAVQKEVDACNDAVFGPKPKQGIVEGTGFQHDFYEQLGKVTGTPESSRCA